MNCFAPVNLYCERTDAAFWSEPLNAFSNISFVIASAILCVKWRAGMARDVPTLALIGVVALIGVGSFLFHTLATEGAELLDVVPIAVFVFGYVLLALRRVVHASLSTSLGAATAVTAVAATLEWFFPLVLNGSAGYLPALAALLAIGVTERATPILAAAGVFALALVFRSIDFVVCDLVPIGTHFLWHILTALTLYIALRAIMSKGEHPS